MLTRRLTGLLLAAVTLVGTTVITLVQVSPAAAEDCWQQVETSPGVYEYVNTCAGDDGEGEGDDGGDGGDDGGGSTEPECYLGREDIFDYDWSYCEGELSCYVYSPPPTAPTPEDWPEKPAGTPDGAVYAVLTCFTQPPEEDVVIYENLWLEPPEDVINWEQEAVQAFGQLVAPDFDLAFNPPAKSYVTLDTWYWAEGATDGEIEGTSAAGLVATATPERLEVQPGDGSGTLNCPFSVTQSDACSYVYEKASVNGTATVDGEPAYAGQARLVYTVRFEFNGEIMEIAGAPTVFETPWEGTPIPVAEIQAIVQDE
ncbi:hypothetical protein E1212_05560 [Jiangella ureilytica]|uniref:Uncharacterized protein n=1 Tax=Jiangella ureilytica TaxID=2530374 RepID=A0A4R4RVB2_9ACTN|nr:hypothetical protein [Jiangella ureilytica]TDC53634.1 hypothetical protein E1212_05560 [Jiangella ureilytica]